MDKEQSLREVTKAVTAVRERFVGLIVSLSTALVVLPTVVLDEGSSVALFKGAYFISGSLLLIFSILCGLAWIVLVPDLIKHAYDRKDLAKIKDETHVNWLMNRLFNGMITLFLLGAGFLLWALLKRIPG